MTTKSTRAPEFQKWLDEWMALARFRGKLLENPKARIENLVTLWGKSIPEPWKRNAVPHLSSGYRRKLEGKKKTPEHEIEKTLFASKVKMVGYDSFVPTANAFPLAHGRTVEVDVIAIEEQHEATEVFLVEVKNNANNAWYAVVENLRQLKLFEANRLENLGFLKISKPPDAVQVELKMAGLILAPPAYFTDEGQKSNSVKPATDLIARFQMLGVRIMLGEWHQNESRIQIHQSGKA